MRVFLKKMLVFSLNASSFSGNFEMSVVIGPSCRQATEKFDGSSLRPSGNAEVLPLRAYLQGFSYWPLQEVRKAKYVKLLAGQDIALAVEGAPQA